MTSNMMQEETKIILSKILWLNILYVLYHFCFYILCMFLLLSDDSTREANIFVDTK